MSARQVASRTAVTAESDAYGQEIWNCYKGVSTYEIVERDDGLIDIGSALPYFSKTRIGRSMSGKRFSGLAGPFWISAVTRAEYHYSFKTEATASWR